LEAAEPVGPRGEPRWARRIGHEEEPAPPGGKPCTHRIPGERAYTMGGVEKYHGNAADTEPCGLAAVTIEQRLEVSCDARRAPTPELSGLVVGRQEEPGLAGVPKEIREGEGLLALSAPPRHEEAVQASRSCQGELPTHHGRVATVVRRLAWVVRRAHVEPPGLGGAARVVESEDALGGHLQARMVPMSPPTGRPFRRPLPRIVNGEDETRLGRQRGSRRVQDGCPLAHEPERPAPLSAPEARRERHRQEP